MSTSRSGRRDLKKKRLIPGSEAIAPRDLRMEVQVMNGIVESPQAAYPLSPEEIGA